MAVTSDGPPLHTPTKPPPRTDGKLKSPKMATFTALDAAFMVTSMLTLVADVATDVNLVVRYFLSGQWVWAGLTLALILIAAVVVSVMSLRWHLAEARDEDTHVTKIHWVTNICLWGILHRYVLMFAAGLKARRTQDPDDFRVLVRQQSDASILRVFECFLEAAPQLVLQMYIMLSVDDYSVWTGITAISSLVSLGWGLAAYTKAMRKSRPDKHKMSVTGIVLQMAWRVGTIAARVAALALAATVLQPWIFLILGLHFVVMWIWVVKQKTEFSKTKWEEHTFNFIMAVTYCFCFFNLKEGHARWRMVVFYSVMVLENVGLTLTYYFLSHHQLWIKNIALAAVLAAMALGLLCMSFYYRFFHPIGPIKPFSNKIGAIEEGLHEIKDPTSPSSDIWRDFKYLYPVGCNHANSILSAPGVPLSTSPSPSRSNKSSSETLPVSHDESYTSPPPHKHPGTMRTVQDLLANVSKSDIQVEEEREHSELALGASAIISADKRDLEFSPTSFERSITREFNSKLTALNKDSKIELHEIRKEEKSQAQIEMTNLMRDFNSKLNALNTIDSKTELHEVKKDSNTQEINLRETEAKHSPREVKCTNLEPMDDGKEKSENLKSTTPPKTNYITGFKDNYTSHVNSSPNNVGLPLPPSYTSQVSLNEGAHSRSASILRTSTRGGKCTSETDVRLTSLPNITASTVNATNIHTDTQADIHIDTQCEYQAPHVPNVELAVIDRMHIIETDSSGVSEGQSDYENIYEKDAQGRNLPPKPLNLVVPANLNETQTTQSSKTSIPHDYENICAVNINREVGVRHWRTYADIETRLHDDSTFKERLKLLDSTIASTIISEHSILKGRSRRSISLVDDCDSVLSRSLPDLSALKLETCFEEPEEEEPANLADIKTDQRLMDVLMQLRANNKNKSNSVDDIPNYETIWIGDVRKPESQNTSINTNSTGNKSSLVVTIGDVRAKESLCNLYYSTMSDLSFRYYSERMRRNYSIGSLSSHSHHTSHSSAREIVRAISVPDNKTLLEVSELIDEQRKIEEQEAKAEKEPQAPINVEPLRQLVNTPLGVNVRPRRKFSLLRERFEHPLTPLKSPLRKGNTPQRRNSLQDRTAKALQAGIKVFRRPRVHVITPKKEDSKDTPRLKSPFKTKVTTPTGTTPTIRKPGDTPIQSTGEIKKLTKTHQTPQLRNSENKLLKGTPKTSTPDDTKQKAATKFKTALEPNKVKLMEGPKTSTPEGNKQLPQISILSAVSSVVASPENIKPRMPLSENFSHNIITQTHIQHTNIEQGKISSMVSLKNTRVAQGSENYEGMHSQFVSGFQKDQRKVYGSRDDLRYQGTQVSQPMFPGALSLPVPETKQTIISISETTESPHCQQKKSISHIVLSSPQSPEINLQKSTLSPNSKIFSRRI